MTEREPTSAQALTGREAAAIPWEEARWRLAEGQFYWLATSDADGRPHVRPVLAVWADGALHFCAGATTRKGKNLARDARCVVTVASHKLHLVLEGEAARVQDEARLQRVAQAYATKYDWPVTVREGAFYADGAPTAGPPPYDVYQVIPSRTFAFGEDESFNPTRWRF